MDTTFLWATICMSCPVVLAEFITRVTATLAENRKMTHFPLCINCRILEMKSQGLKHFLVQCFSNYRSLATRPISGPLVVNVSELQSTFFSFNEMTSEGIICSKAKFLWCVCVYTLCMQGAF